MMWKSRLSAVLARPFEEIALVPTKDAPFRGRYIRIGHAVLGIGRLLGMGGEAIVYELIDLELSQLTGVVKICRFPPDTHEYRRWAVPIRFEGNSRSLLAEVELYPALLLSVPGGLVKIQNYVSADPDEDWATLDSVGPLSASDLVPIERLNIADALLQRHGNHGVLLEARGKALVELERIEEAVDSLERAMALFQTESRAGLLRTAPLLAWCYRKLYQDVRWKGAAAILSAPGLGRQVVFADPEAAAKDDTLEDKALYVALEALDAEPSSVPNLFVVADAMMASWITISELEGVLQAIERVCPGHPDATRLREEYTAMCRDRVEAFNRLAASAPGSSQGSNHSGDETSRDASSAKSDGLQYESDASRAAATPDEPHDYLARFDQAYRPEPDRGQTIEARVSSAYANLSANRLAQAEAAARGAIALDAGHVGAHLALARVLCAAGRASEAEILLREASGSLHPNAEMFGELGYTQLIAEKFEAARATLLRALVCEPEDAWTIRLNLGTTCRKLGCYAESLVWLRPCLEQAPADARAILELVYTLRSGPEANLDEALSVIDIGIALSPSDANLLVCRAQLAGMKKDWPRAIDDLERATVMEPDHPFASKFLASIRDITSRIHV